MDDVPCIPASLTTDEYDQRPHLADAIALENRPLLVMKSTVGTPT